VRRPKTEVNLERLLSGAAAQMARRGFVETSIRDVARETGFSLAGMYYYFRGKEELLYKIQQQTFSTLLREQEALAAGSGTPEEKLRRIVCNHLSYLTSHANELKVCTFELESLRGTYYRRIETLRRRYYKLVASLLGEVTGCPRDGGAGDAMVRHLTLFVFGMLNWVLMWFDRRRDQPTDELGRRMVDLLLRGLPRQRGAASRGRKARGAGRNAGASAPARARRRRDRRVEEGRS
jgi:AcrR family transcriptional regulator